MCTAAAALVGTHPLSSIKGYATVAYDGCCWLGCVVKVDMEARVVEVNFLHPQLPSNSYGHPQCQDVMEVDLSDILTLVSRSTATGRRYYLTAKEVAAATCGLTAKAEYPYKRLHFVVFCVCSALMCQWFTLQFK